MEVSSKLSLTTLINLLLDKDVGAGGMQDWQWWRGINSTFSQGHQCREGQCRLFLVIGFATLGSQNWIKGFLLSHAG